MFPQDTPWSIGKDITLVRNVSNKKETKTRPASALAGMIPKRVYGVRWNLHPIEFLVNSR